jgi:hypothetical protein
MFDQFLNNELVNKVKYLSEALHNAEKKNQTLQTQNDCLIDVIANLASLNKEDYEKCLENSSESIIAV